MTAPAKEPRAPKLSPATVNRLSAIFARKMLELERAQRAAS